MADLNPFASFAQGRQLRYQREDRAREEENRNRMARLFAGGIPTTPEAQQRTVGQIAQSDPRLALDWARHFAGQRPDVLARRKEEAPFVTAELGTVTDQASYDRARQRLNDLGVDVADMPDVYDPQQTNMVLQASRYLVEGAPESPEGPFGKSLKGRAANILLSADPSSPEYAAAYGIMSQPTTYFDQGAGQMVSVAPDMSGYAPPGGRAAPREQPVAKEPEPPMGTPAAPAPKVTDKGGITVQPIPGSKAEREAAKEAEAAEAREETKRTYANIVTQDIDQILSIEDESLLPVTGMFSLLARIPGTPQADVARLLDTIRANVGLDRLQQMRASSPTGAALGNVTERENALLQATLGSLEQSQSASQFRRNLERLKDYYSRIINEGMSDEEISRAMETLETGGAGTSFEGMSDQQFLNMPITEENAEEWNAEYERRMGQ